MKKMNTIYEGSEQGKKNPFPCSENREHFEIDFGDFSKPLGMWEPLGPNSDSEDEKGV